MSWFDWWLLLGVVLATIGTIVHGPYGFFLAAGCMLILMPFFYMVAVVGSVQW